MEKKKFQKLVERYLNGEASAEERELTEKYLDAFQRNAESWDSPLMGDQDLIRKDLYEKTLHEISLREQKEKIFKWRWLSAAAIFIIFLSGIYYSVRYNDSEVTASTERRFKNDISPGSTKAVLTLADGTRIVLDDKKNGALANQGNIIIKKTRQGQLIYDLSKVEAHGGIAENAYNTISTPNGGKYMLILEDGTRIWLNSASSLKFPVSFTGDSRKVELSGEAYFEVARNKAKPFMVSAGNTEVKVLGTHFNINSYTNEPIAKTTLIEGAVEVSNDKHTALLKPGEQAGISNSASQAIRIEKNVDTEHVLAWKNGLFEFSDAKVSEIMRQLSRWYNIEVEYEAGLPDEEFTGIISQSVRISKVLEMLEQGGGVAFKIEGRKVTVMATKE